MSVRVGLGVAGVLLLASSAGAAPQQKAAAQTGPATTVAPLTVAPAPIPNVGKGAPLYTAEELKTAAKQAQKDVTDTVTNTCMKGNYAFPPPNSPFPRNPDTEISFSAFYWREVQASEKAETLAGRAAKATEDAAAARGQAAADPSKAQAAIDAELARQQAVNAFVAARGDVAEVQAEIKDLADLVDRNQDVFERARPAAPDDVLVVVQAGHQVFGPFANVVAQARAEIAAKRAERAAKGGAEVADADSGPKGLTLVNVATQSKSDKKGLFVVVTGQIHNAGAKAVAIPAISIDAVDQGGKRLSGFVADPDGKQTVPPGQNMAFSYTFRPTPQRAIGFSVGFAGEQGYGFYSPATVCPAH